MNKNMDDASRTGVVALKSYGDFVIAWDAVKHARDARGDRPRMVIGRHLLALAQAIGCDEHVVVGDDRWTDVPAAFDVGKRGKSAAMASLLDARRRLAAVEADRLVVDRLGWRERLIVGRRRAIALPTAENIYASYAMGLGQLGFSRDAPCETNAAVPRTALLVPGSRLPHKVVPAPVLESVGAALADAGLKVAAMRLEGEPWGCPTGLNVVTVPRQFEMLVATLLDADIVISADSLAAHLGEHLGRDTFVVTPVPNRYWLPRNAFADDAWCTFDELGPLRRWLQRRVATKTDARPLGVGASPLAFPTS